MKKNFICADEIGPVIEFQIPDFDNGQVSREFFLNSITVMIEIYITMKVELCSKNQVQLIIPTFIIR